MKRLPLPVADLEIQKVEDETLVYDPVWTRIHLLNPPCARVFEACRNQEPAAAVERELGREGLRQALEAMHRAALLEKLPSRRPSRREILAGASAVLITPLVTSMSLPAAAAAASVCVTSPTTCTSAVQPAGGNSAGNGPQGCTSCCGSGSFACSTCPGACSTCFCMRLFFCSNNGANSTPCNAAPNGNICLPGSTDFPSNRICITPGGFFQQDCATARANAGAGLSYRCCRC